MFPRKPTIETSLPLTKGQLLEPLIIKSKLTSTTYTYLAHDLVYHVNTGTGIAWIKSNNSEYMCDLAFGTSIFLPKGSYIQFKNNNTDYPLVLNHYSMPGCDIPESQPVDQQCETWEINHYLSPPETLVKTPSAAPDYRAADGSEGRSLVTGNFGKLNQFTLKPNTTSTAIKHALIEEIWHINSGTGQMWLKSASGHEEVLELSPGASLTIPTRTTFQFRNMSESDNLVATVMTMPPFPGDHIISFTSKEKWTPTKRTPETNNPLHSMLENKLQHQITGCHSSVFQRSCAIAAEQEAADNQLNNDGTNNRADIEAAENISSTGSTVSVTPTAKLT